MLYKSDTEIVSLFVYACVCVARFSSFIIPLFRKTKAAFTCSELTIETLKQGVKYAQS